MSFWCLQIDQKTNKSLVRLSALASKKRSYKKTKGTLYPNWMTLFSLSYLLFWFDLFLEARVETLKKIVVFLVYFEDTKRTFRIKVKRLFKVIWPDFATVSRYTQWKQDNFMFQTKLRMGFSIWRLSLNFFSK